ncbi:MAG: tetratricopeptide repeat protein [Opitutaceae bacterium]|jgi:hypothetical protein
MATLRLYQGSTVFAEIEDYSVVKSLLFDVVAQTPNSELSPFEKLRVVHEVGRDVHRGYLADVHMACGCFAEAREHYQKPDHPRKLGDICWCEGKLDEAEQYYRQSSSDAQFYRTGPDYDRLIKLAFFRDQPACIVSLFGEADFGRGFFEGQVSIGRSHTSASSYVQILACAVVQLGIPTPEKVATTLESAFSLSAADWQKILSSEDTTSLKMIDKLKKRCRPKIGAALPMTVTEACRRGDSARARLVADYIKSADESLEPAQAALESFGTSGDETKLAQFMAYVTGSGVESLSRSFLFAALGHDSFTSSNIPADRMIRLLSSHPIMNRRHFGKLLALRFQNAVPLDGDDILTGLFQSIGNLPPATTKKTALLSDVSQLASCREWARVRLDEWIAGRAKLHAELVAEKWREGAMTASPHRFAAAARVTIASPRDTSEWSDFLAEALAWLRARYSREIGATPWVTENQLFQLLRRQLKGMEVIQHARPTWLDPQHLDVYIPKADVAIEYMGRQHFEPLEFFGGRSAFEALAERDCRKADLCRERGVELLYVRFDENLAVRAKQVIEYVRAK